MDWEGKRLFVKFLTRKIYAVRARDRKQENKSRREYSCQYFLKKGDSLIRVCKPMFLKSLSIGERIALQWQKESDEQEERDDESEMQDQDNDTPPAPVHKKLRKSAEVEALQDFFLSLPKLESHYCRKRTTKLYIEPTWKSKNQLFRFYKTNWCVEKNIFPLSECRFAQIFDDYNLSLYQPKKDACDTCEGYKKSNVPFEQYETHILKKDQARTEKEKDKEDQTVQTFAMDLQSLLQSPRSNVSALYYKLKLSIHYFTIINLNTKDGFCFMWNETEGGITSNEFSTILSNFVLSQLPLSEVKSKIVLYSDGCAYQNRSNPLANALLHLSTTKNIIIEQKYLEVGHTQMEADSMHSLIERRLKNTK